MSRMTSSGSTRELPDDALDVLNEVRRALHVSDETLAAFERACTVDPTAHRGRVGVDVWVFEPTGTHVLLVDHPVRGWVAPGGKVDIGEHPCAAAARELHEETGVVVDRALLQPAAAHVNSATGGYSVSYATMVARDVMLTPEPLMNGLRWWPLSDEWQSVYPHDRARICRFVAAMHAGQVAPLLPFVSRPC